MVEQTPGAGRNHLHGRQREISLLDAAIDALGHGRRSGVVLLEGQTGTGKTSLIENASLRASREGIQFLRAQARAADRGRPFKSILDALGGCAQTMSTIADIESHLSRAALRRPVVVALDDVHDADDATLHALRTLPGRLSCYPILWLLALVPGRADMTSRALVRASGTVVRIGPLDRDALRAIAHDILGGTPAEAVLDLVADLNGHPASSVELLRAMVEEGLVELTNGCARLTGHGLRYALCELGVRHPPTTGGNGAGASVGLTRSEIAVVELVARGATNRQAAEQLFLSPHTISTHLRHTFEKLGIRSRIELAMMFAEPSRRLSAAAVNADREDRTVARCRPVHTLAS